MSSPIELEDRASIFAALGDATRLSLLATLLDGSSPSISQLAQGSRLTRRAISKHLHVLEQAGIVASERHGRESRYQLTEAQAYLAALSAQWVKALERLRSFSEDLSSGIAQARG